MKNKKKLIIIGIGTMVLTNILSLTFSGLATWYITKENTEPNQEQSSDKEETTQTEEYSEQELDSNSNNSTSRKYNFEGLSFKIPQDWSICWHSEPNHSSYYQEETTNFKPYILISPNLVNQTSEHTYAELGIYFSRGNDVEEITSQYNEEDVDSFQDETFGEIKKYFNRSPLDPGERYIFYDKYNNQSILIKIRYRNVSKDFVKSFIADIKPTDNESVTITHSLNSINTRVTLPNNWQVTSKLIGDRMEYTLSSFQETIILANHIGMGACERAATSEKWECIYDEYTISIGDHDVECQASAEIEAGQKFTREDTYGLFVCENIAPENDEKISLVSTTFTHIDIDSYYSKTIFNSIEVK